MIDMGAMASKSSLEVIRVRKFKLVGETTYMGELYTF